MIELVRRMLKLLTLSKNLVINYCRFSYRDGVDNKDFIFSLHPIRLFTVV
jgi:hypothetical protein